MIKQKKQASASLYSLATPSFDAMGPPPEPSEVPLAVQFVQLPDTTESQFESADPDQSQQHGITVHKFPVKNPKKEDESPKTNLDDRMIELIDLIESIKK